MRLLVHGAVKLPQDAFRQKADREEKGSGNPGQEARPTRLLRLYRQPPKPVRSCPTKQASSPAPYRHRSWQASESHEPLRLVSRRKSSFVKSTTCKPAIDRLSQRRQPTNSHKAQDISHTVQSNDTFVQASTLLLDLSASICASHPLKCSFLEYPIQPHHIIDPASSISGPPETALATMSSPKRRIETDVSVRA